MSTRIKTLNIESWIIGCYKSNFPIDDFLTKLIEGVTHFLIKVMKNPQKFVKLQVLVDFLKSLAKTE